MTVTPLMDYLSLLSPLPLHHCHPLHLWRSRLATSGQTIRAITRVSADEDTHKHAR